MLDHFRHRSLELEHLDKGDYTDAEYQGCLVELRRVNRFLGDAWALRTSLFSEVERAGLKSFSVLDLGAGSGELLRLTATWARRTGRRAFLAGLEINAAAAKAIRTESVEFPEIAAVRANALGLPFASRSFDYVVCSLFTHHFKDDGVRAILREMNRVARCAVIVIDLHRHPLAYFLFTTAAKLFFHNRLIRSDGALSILRSFVPAELMRLARAAGLQSARVRRRFPFRLVLAAQKQGACR